MYIPHCDGSPKIIVFSGAGLDAPSGLDTFNEIWQNADKKEVCNIHTYKENYEKVLNFYNRLKQKICKSPYNDYHHIVEKLYIKNKENMINITTNFTPFFEKMQIPTLYVHGKITEMQCPNCGNFYWGLKEFVKSDVCPKCKQNNFIKPNIVFYEESAPLYTYMNRAFECLKNPKSVFIVIGASSNVIDVDLVAKYSDALTILCDINPGHRETFYDYTVTSPDELQKLLIDLKLGS